MGFLTISGAAVEPSSLAFSSLSSFQLPSSSTSSTSLVAPISDVPRSLSPLSVSEVRVAGNGGNETTHAPLIKRLETAQWYSLNDYKRLTPRQIAMQTSMRVIKRAVLANAKCGYTSVRVRVDASLLEEIKEELTRPKQRVVVGGVKRLAVDTDCSPEPGEKDTCVSLCIHF